jgi:hypothetical protein
VHRFTLTLDLDYATEAQMDAVAEVADDLMVGSSGGVAVVACDREAGTFEVAVRSAVADVGRALPGVRVLRVDVDG